ncbi:MAG TPA: hypothetical protein GYA08_10150 [Chloroflexi bacterium]|nr:hypothetical protein [Chloroflexota bacterium]
MKQGVKQSVDQLKPWRKTTAWWVLLIEGIVGAGLGVALLLWPADAQGWTLLFLAIVLAVQGLLALLGLLRGKRRGNFALIRGAISLIVGMVVILMAIFTVGDRLMAAWLLAAGLLAAGVLTIVAPFFEGDVGVKRGDLLMTAFLLILGGLLTYNIVTGVDVLQILAWTLIVFGAALIVFGILARSRADVAEA